MKDKRFKEKVKVVAHSNPSAKITTSIKTYGKHKIESVYNGENFFWGIDIQEQQYILISFDPTIYLKK